MKSNSDLRREITEYFKPTLEKQEAIYHALKEFEKASREKSESDFVKKLPKILIALTSVTKKKKITDYEFKVKKNYWSGSPSEIGINCNGLGVVDYGQQLSPLANEYNTQTGYEMSSIDFRRLIEIFKNEDLCLEISEAILSRHRKDFIRLASAFRKFEYEPLNEYEKVSIGDNLFLKFDMSRAELDEIIEQEDTESPDDKEVVVIERSNVYKFFEQPVHKGLHCFDFSLQFLFKIDDLLTEKGDIILEKIKEQTEKFKVSEKEQKLNELVSEIALTYEALEKI